MCAARLGGRGSRDLTAHAPGGAGAGAAGDGYVSRPAAAIGRATGRRGSRIRSSTPTIAPACPGAGRRPGGAARALEVASQSPGLGLLASISAFRAGPADPARGWVDVRWRPVGVDVGPRQVHGEQLDAVLLVRRRISCSTEAIAGGVPSARV